MVHVPMEGLALIAGHEVNHGFVVDSVLGAYCVIQADHVLSAAHVLGVNHVLGGHVLEDHASKVDRVIVGGHAGEVGHVKGHVEGRVAGREVGHVAVHEDGVGRVEGHVMVHALRVDRVHGKNH